MKKLLTIVLCTLFVTFSVASSTASANRALPQETTPKQDIKDAGHSTKTAAKKTGSATKKETKKVVNKSAKKTAKTADKVEDKTEPK